MTSSSWPRPVPLLGDTTSSSERSADPTGWKFPDDAISNLFSVISSRRDIRRFRADPISAEILQQVLLAGHLAPSVGHSQPWRFIVVDDPLIRQQAALFADKERMRQASLLAPDSAQRLLDLQLEGIREAPIGIVVCCDRRVPAAGVLGRATFPDTDMWSVACAIENIWLTARAHGLGLGWVTLFNPTDLSELLSLPQGVETLGWLCIGWPDERPPKPGLERVGWSKRMPLEDVIFYNSWPDASRDPISPRSHLKIPIGEEIVSVRDTTDTFLTTPGSLGVIDRAVDRIENCMHPHARSALLLIAASDHSVTRYEISAYAPAITHEIFEATSDGVSLGASLAKSCGLDIELVNAGVQNTSIDLSNRGDLVTSAALTVDECHQLMELGRSTMTKLSKTHGIVALGEIGIGNTTVASTLAAALLKISATDAVGLGSSADATIIERKIWVVEKALSRVNAIDPISILQEFSGGEFAFMVGAILEAARLRVCIILDGLATTVAALLACRIEPAVQAILIAGQKSREKVHGLILQELGLEPILDLRIRSGEGAGATLAANLLLATLKSRALVARTQTERE